MEKSHQTEWSGWRQYRPLQFASGSAECHRELSQHSLLPILSPLRQGRKVKKRKKKKKKKKKKNPKDFNRGTNWAKAFGLAAGLGLIGSTVAKVLTKNKQKENDYVVKQQMNEVSNQKEFDYYKKTGKLPKYTGKKRG